MFARSLRRPDKPLAKKQKRREKQLSYNECIADLINHPKVRQMDHYIHHGSVSCLEHCLSVSFYAYSLSRRLGRHFRTDPRSAARSGLLHDLYLYDPHDGQPREGFHGLAHPARALANASEWFDLNANEADAIKNHMWPLTPHLPRSSSGWIICLIDKYCAVNERFYLSTQFKLYPHNAVGRLAVESAWVETASD
jgi:uncharacterized protein